MEGDEGIFDLQIQSGATDEDKGVPKFNVEGVGNIDKKTDEGDEEEKGENNLDDQGNETAREGDLDRINEQHGEDDEQKLQGEEVGEGEEDELNQDIDIINENS